MRKLVDEVDGGKESGRNGEGRRRVGDERGN